MVPRLQKIDAALADSVDEPMFLGDAPRPAICQYELQWFRLANTCERGIHHRFHEFQSSKRYFPVGFHPISQVLAKFRLEYRLTLNGPSQAPSPAAACPPIPACLSREWRAATPPAGAEHGHSRGRPWTRASLRGCDTSVSASKSHDTAPALLQRTSARPETAAPAR